VTVTVKGTKQLLRRLDAIQHGRPVLRDVQIRAVREAKQRVARATGHTARTIAPGDLTDTYTIVRAAGAAPFLEFGTKPHVIRPRNKKMLSWTTGKRLSGRNRTGKGAGSRIFAAKVNHPGTKAQPFLLPGAVEAVRQVGVQPIIKAWNDAA
jgi:hypothetical protein